MGACHHTIRPPQLAHFLEALSLTEQILQVQNHAATLAVYLKVCNPLGNPLESIKSQFLNQNAPRPLEIDEDLLHQALKSIFYVVDTPISCVGAMAQFVLFTSDTRRFVLSGRLALPALPGLYNPLH